jgi:hypothetical protein
VSAPVGWSIERPATGSVIARGPNGEVAMEENCRRCGVRVIGAIDPRGVGVYLEVSGEQILEFRDGMPHAARGSRTHTHPESK